MKTACASLVALLLGSAAALHENECNACSPVPAAEQLAAMRQLLLETTDDENSPPDPIYGIWYAASSHPHPRYNHTNT